MEAGGIIYDGTVDINSKQQRKPLAFRRRPGASLVEMLIAIIVLGVVLISMVGMFVISRTAIFSKEDETAVTLALRYLEDLEERDFEEFAPGSGFFPITQNDQKYTITASVTEYDSFRARINVEIKWRASIGEKTVELDRIVSSVGYKNVGERRDP